MKIIRIISFTIVVFLLFTCNFADEYIGVNKDFLPEEESTTDNGTVTTPFSPRNITGLGLWLDASDTGTITTSGTDVTQWSDKSGNNRNFWQNTVAYRPNINATGLNNKNTILFTQAAPNYNKLQLFSGTIECLISTIFIVYKPATDFAYYFLGNDTGAGAFRISVSTNVNTFNVAYSGATAENIIVTNLSDNNAHILMVKLRGNNNKFMVSLDGDVESNSVNDFLLKTTYPFNILGADTNASTTIGNIFNGDIAEVIIFTTLLSTTDKQKIEGYVAHKWGLTGNLPSDHPYKYSAP